MRGKRVLEEIRTDGKTLFLRNRVGSLMQVAKQLEEKGESSLVVDLLLVCEDITTLAESMAGRGA